MFTVLTGLDCFCPSHAGLKDILIAGDKIAGIADPGFFKRIYDYCEVIHCEGLLAFPGIIDQHIHLIGGGGENGPASRIGDISIEDIFMAGVTTVVGVLGFDSYTKSLQSLLAQANTLEAKGLTAYIYTGSYAIPTVTVTGSIANDLILIDKIIGTGEIAISDYRSSQPTFNEFAQLAAKTHIAGLISGKAGIVHIHIGDGKERLTPLTQLLDKTDLPKAIFVPTHVNRNPELFSEAVAYCRSGGNIDLTAGEKKGIPVPKAVKMLLESGAHMDKVSISSDANGSDGQSVIKIQTFFEDIKNGILNENIPPASMFALVTQNVAKTLKLYPTKGVIQKGSDADILIMDKQYNIEKLYCKGRLCVSHRQIVEETT